MAPASISVHQAFQPDRAVSVSLERPTYHPLCVAGERATNRHELWLLWVRLAAASAVSSIASIPTAAAPAAPADSAAATSPAKTSSTRLARRPELRFGQRELGGHHRLELGPLLGRQHFEQLVTSLAP